MTSKQALTDLFTISNKITKDKLNLDTKEIFERYKVIREDLEVLEILKKHLFIRIEDKPFDGNYLVALQEYASDEYDDYTCIFVNEEEKEKIKEWLEERENDK